MYRCPTVAVIASLVVFAHVSKAEECSRAEKARAKPHFEAGAKAFRIGELDKAADEFKAAYEACSSPLFLYNLGQTYRQLKQIEKASYFYKQYLSATPSDDERRDEVTALVAKLEDQLQDERRQAAPRDTPPPAVDRAPATAPSPQVATDTSISNTARREPAAERRPLYKRWWLWSIVGVVAVGAAVGVGLGVSQSNKQPYFAPGVTF